MRKPGPRGLDPGGEERMRSDRFAFLAAAAALFLLAGRADAIPLNDDETINVSLRAYANVRIGTNSKQSTRLERPNSFGGTFVYSPSWKVIQNRYFLDVEWDHDILPMFDDLFPEWVSSFEYTLAYRGEYEGIYDFGPSQYSGRVLGIAHRQAAQDGVLGALCIVYFQHIIPPKWFLRLVLGPEERLTCLGKPAVLLRRCTSQGQPPRRCRRSGATR